MRTAFIQQLIKEAEINKNIFLIVGDLGFSVVEEFSQRFPDRFINAGVAEQNMTGIAAGLSMEGYNVFTYSIGNFPTLRCMEQIRYDVCYHNLNVKVVAVGGGYAYGSLGPSHHATEEIGMLRTIPNLYVSAPGDPIETKAITSFLCQYNGPGYIRLGKAGEPNIHKSEIDMPYNNEAIVVRNGQETCVLTTGAMLKYANDFINANNLSFGLVSMPVIKPMDLLSLQKVSSTYKFLITLEEHQKSAGFGSAILEGINDLLEKKLLDKSPLVRRIAIPDIFISVAGTQDFLRGIANLEL
jgi:transketolase